MMHSLDEWEALLRPQFMNIQLIGELSLSVEETASLARGISRLMKFHDFERGTRFLCKHYPRAFAAFLVFQGQHHFDASNGDYWSAVRSAIELDLSSLHTSEWGQAFEEITDEFDLSHTFGGFRYVGAILGHGGIPSTSLPDFFERMLQPCVTRAELTGLSDAELIDEWLTRSRYLVNQSILRFLKYGGTVAQDFVRRCREMANKTLVTGEVPVAEELNLPHVVVSSYREWITETTLLPVAPATAWRLQRPLVRLNPWSEGVYLHLPEQQVPASENRSKLTWQLVSGTELLIIPVRAKRVDFNLRTGAVDEPIQNPYPDLIARFMVDDTCKREWRYKLDASSQQPMLVFDPQSGTAHPTQRYLPRKPLWVLLPPSTNLIDTGPIREELPRLPWGWHEWKGYEVNLGKASTLAVNTPQGIHHIPINELRPIELVAGIQVDSLDESMPLYIGQLPTIRVPWRGRTPLDRWRFELQHEWDAAPPINEKSSLADIKALRQVAGAVEVPLDHSALLGKAPLGQYRLRVRGPIGREGEWHFRTVPTLQVEGHHALILPNANGAPAVKLSIEISRDAHVEMLQVDSGLIIEEQSVEGQLFSRWSVTVPPHLTEAALRLRYILDDRTVFVPLRVPIRRLRWTLMLQPSQLTWHHAPVRVNLEELDQSQEPYLVVDLPLNRGQKSTVCLQLYDSEGKLCQEVAGKTAQGGARFFRFDLRLIRHTVRNSTSAFTELKLNIADYADHSPVQLSLVRFHRDILLKETSVRIVREGSHARLRLSWQPAILLRDRVARFWPLTRPWEPPISLPLPDDALTFHDVTLPSEALPTGLYLVEFVVEDPWLPATDPSRPALDATHAAVVSLGNRAEHYKETADSTAQFAAGAEQALWAYYEQDGMQLIASLKRCQAALAHATFAQITALLQVFEQTRAAEPAGLVAQLRLSLLGAARLESILRAYAQGELSSQLFSWYTHVLHRFFDERTPSPAIAQLLLSAPKESLRLLAARALIERKHEAGVVAVLKWTEQGHLSEADAIGLCVRSAGLAVEILLQPPMTNLKIRLLEGLVEASDGEMAQVFVRRKQWIWCQAGWGRIESIATYDGREISQVLRNQLTEGYLLHVTVRPGNDEERVTIDTLGQTLRFEQPVERWRCAKCKRFIAQDWNCVAGEHNSTAHEGVQPWMERIRIQVIPQPNDFSVRTRRPPSMWV